MDETTSRLALPLLAPGQAQKEMTHNEALALLDLAVQPVVEAVAVAAPPASPLPGQAWGVGAAATGDWAGRTGAIAGWTTGGWRFVGPVEGMAAWSRADAALARWTGTGWAVPVRSAAIADPAGGTVVDAEVRTAVAGILAALRARDLLAS